jgi:hypothetical protein
MRKYLLLIPIFAFFFLPALSNKAVFANCAPTTFTFVGEENAQSRNLKLHYWCHGDYPPGQSSCKGVRRSENKQISMGSTYTQPDCSCAPNTNLPTPPNPPLPADEQAGSAWVEVVGDIKGCWVTCEGTGKAGMELKECELAIKNGEHRGFTVRVACPGPSPTPGPKCDDSCNNAQTPGACGWKSTDGKCHNGPMPDGKLCCVSACKDNKCQQFYNGTPGMPNSCDMNNPNSCKADNTPTPTPQPPPSSCVEGASCGPVVSGSGSGQQCSNNDAGKCSPGCAGGWCNGGKCSCTPPTQPPNTPPPPTNTPAPTATPTPAVQQVSEISLTPTPTSQPGVTPSASARVKLAQKVSCLQAFPCLTSGECAQAGNLADRVALKLKPNVTPIPNKDVYIFECFQMNNQQICTTGDSSVDSQATVFGNDNAGELRSKGYVFGTGTTGLWDSTGTNRVSNPLSTLKPSDKLHWESSYPSFTGRIFMMMQKLDDSDINGGAGGQQLGTIDFNSAQSKCIMIKWDPYGRVYDSYTLEPLSDAQVTLFSKQANQFKEVATTDIPGLRNPIKTNVDGSFNFYTPPGTYQLKVSLPSYTFPSAQKQNTDYKKAYYDVYSGGEIVQKNEPVHVDIPMDPVDKDKAIAYAKDHPAKVVSSIQSLDKQTHAYDIEGIVSHPLSLIRIYGKKLSSNGTFDKTRVIGNAVADNHGNFQVHIPISTLNPGESIGEIEAVKNLPTVHKTSEKNTNIFSQILSFIFGGVSKESQADQPQSSAVSVDPLLNSLTGIAYDQNKNVLANTTVGIVLEGSKSPIFTIDTDNKGYFSLPEQYIPTINYAIQYIKAGTVIRTLTTSQFLQDNIK